MDFFLFLLVNAVLFVRPAEVLPALNGLPIYNALMLAALAVGLGQVIGQLFGRAWSRRPVTACVASVGAAAVFSNLALLDFWSARAVASDFAKILLYYALMLAVLRTPERLLSFARWLAVFIAAVTALSLLHYHGAVNLPALEALERWDTRPETGERYLVVQLCATGYFNDPNDFSLILVVGVWLAAHGLSGRAGGVARWAWLAPLLMFGYALVQTRSRGGLLAFLTGLPVLLVSRFGWRRAVPLALLVLPGVPFLVGGRQARLSTGEGTAQARIHLWRDSLTVFRSSPRVTFAGYGARKLVDEIGQVTHNSFVQAYAEWGLIGGTAFLACFGIPVAYLARPGQADTAAEGEEVLRLRPYLAATVAGYAVGLLSLSRGYVVVTYLIVGLADVFLQVAPLGPDATPRLDAWMAARLAVGSAAFLLAVSIFVRLSGS